MAQDTPPTPPPHRRAGPARAPALLLGAAVAAVALLSVSAWCLRAWVVLQYPYQLDYMEGSAINWAAWAAAGLPLYPAIGDGPFIHHAYMPLYMGLVTLHGQLGVLSLPIMRLLTVVPSFLIGLVLVAAIRQRGAPWLVALAGAGLWFSWPAVYTYGMFVRPEPLGTLFCVVGFARLRATGVGVCEAIVWFGLAILCKQPFLFSAVGAGVWLLLADRRAAGRFAAGMALFGGAMLGLAWWRTGANFWWHTVVATRNPWSWGPVVVWAQYNAVHLGAPCLLAAWAVVRECRAGRPSPWPVYCVEAWLASLLVGKEGSAMQYFVEVGAPTVVMAASAVQALLRSQSPWRLAVATALAVATSVPLAHWPGRLPIYRYRARYVYDFLPDARAKAERAAVVEWIRRRSGDVVCYDMDLVVLAGKRSWLQPWMFQTLARHGVWDETPLVRQVDAGKFAAILLQYPAELAPELPGAAIMYSPAFHAAVARRYEAIATLRYADGRPWWYCYAPRPMPGEREAPARERPGD